MIWEASIATHLWESLVSASGTGLFIGNPILRIAGMKREGAQSEGSLSSFSYWVVFLSLRLDSVCLGNRLCDVRWALKNHERNVRERLPLNYPDWKRKGFEGQWPSKITIISCWHILLHIVKVCLHKPGKRKVSLVNPDIKLPCPTLLWVLHLIWAFGAIWRVDTKVPGGSTEILLS